MLLSGATDQWRKGEQVHVIRIVQRTASGSPRPGGSRCKARVRSPEEMRSAQPDVGPRDAALVRSGRRETILGMGNAVVGDMGKMKCDLGKMKSYPQSWEKVGVCVAWIFHMGYGQRSCM